MYIRLQPKLLIIEAALNGDSIGVPTDTFVRSATIPNTHYGAMSARTVGSLSERLGPGEVTTNGAEAVCISFLPCSVASVFLMFKFQVCVAYPLKMAIFIR